MLQRIDALGFRPAHLQLLTGAILQTDPDQVLQEIVAEACRRLKAPMALVSILLERTQFFRAHRGLPADLAIACSTDRDASFCQFVVMEDATFEVTDARSDSRVPQDLVQRYGIESYLGVPVRVRNQAVGSLCVIDIKPREFTKDERLTMTDLARQASQRLTALSTVRKSAWPLLGSATKPIFAEIRNVLAPLSANVATSRIAAADLGPLRRLAEYLTSSQLADLPALGSLTQATRALDDLREMLEDLDQLAKRLQQDIVALESAVIGEGHGCKLTEVIHAADRLARHQTKLMGGVVWSALPSDGYLSASRGTAIAVLSFVLTSLAEMFSSSQPAAPTSPGIHVSCKTQPGWLDLFLHCERLSGHQHELIVDQVGLILPDDESVQVCPDQSATIVRFIRQS